MTYLRLAGRTLSCSLCILLIIPLMALTWCLRLRKATRAIMQCAFRFGSWVCNVRIRTQGTLDPGRPLLLVSNHFSYIDMFVLGSMVPAAFTPKSEIARWPVIGTMCKMSGCLFIDRRASQTAHNKTRLEKALREGDIISLFPEGTTNEGVALLPFKSAFFSLAYEHTIHVQPATIRYTALNGKPIDASSRPLVGWYGEAEFFPHLLHFLKQQGVDADLVFHAPVNARDFPSRKALALYCHDVIEKPLKDDHNAAYSKAFSL